MSLEQTDVKPDAQGKVVDLSSFRRKKEAVEEFARGRQPLYSSHLNAATPPSASKSSQQVESQDFGARLQRIRSSLEKINRLMSELKKMSAPTDDSQMKPRQ